MVPQEWKPVSTYPIEAHFENQPFPWRQAVFTSFLLFLFVATLPIAERLIPERYKGMDFESTLVSLEEDGVLATAGLDLDSVERMLLEEDVVAYIGRALYPRHYLAYLGNESMHHPAFNKRNYARLGFVLAPIDVSVVVPLKKSPARFPNAADVLVVGCQRADHVEALFVVTLTQPTGVIKRFGPDLWSCATP